MKREPYTRKNPRPIGELTLREREVMELVLRGKSNKEISDKLFVQEKTVRAHLIKIYLKTGVKSRAQLIVKGWDLDKIGQKLRRK
jgi:DNA-binding CsgD family transcriptional regulator